MYRQRRRKVEKGRRKKQQKRQWNPQEKNQWEKGNGICGRKISGKKAMESAGKKAARKRQQERGTETGSAMQNETRKKSRKKSRMKTAGLLVLVLFLCVAVGVWLILSKIWNCNQYLVSGYAMRGVDVSHYQGEIDWEQLKKQGVDFAFIKATEGSSHLDETFEANWQAAEEAELYAGAYHFFSFDSEGRTQAEWYIQNVGNLSGRLVPVVDVEYYADKEANPPEKEQVVWQLKDLLRILEETYQKKPILYTTYKVYHRYIEHEFDEYPLWIRNVYYSPNLDMNGKWQFWQYMDTAVLEGYKGTETYIDLNVFIGTEEELKAYLVD